VLRRIVEVGIIPLLLDQVRKEITQLLDFDGFLSEVELQILLRRQFLLTGPVLVVVDLESHQAVY
jgi:hypothetical protein